MKKLISLLSVAMLATSVFAIPATVKKMSTEIAPKMQTQVATHPGNDFQLEQIQVPFAPKQVAYKAEPAIKKAAQVTEAAAVSAGYYKPIGSFFCGIGDVYYAAYGKNIPGTSIFATAPTVVGSWLNDYEYWTWPNLAENATSLEYIVGFDKVIGKKYGWDMDAKGNYLDSLNAFWAGDSHSWYSYRMPVQIASDGTNADTFLLVGPKTTRPDTLLGEALTVGGMFNPYTQDGLWPLTNAIFSTPKYGKGLGLVWNRDNVNHTVSYIFGTEPVALKAGLDTLYEEDGITIKEVIQLYDTIQPSAIAVSYQKPMSPLYIKDVTVALGNLVYIADSADWYYDDIKIDTLKMYITVTDPTTGTPTVIAASEATKDDTVSMASYPGQQVTFKIQKKVGLATVEGVTVSQAFTVLILGLDREGNKFGIWSGLNPYLGNMQTTVIDTAYQAKKYAPYDPFVMLNGIYYTMEHVLRTGGVLNKPKQYINDTINVKVNYDDEYDEYWVSHADGSFAGYTPMLRAMELLYDTVSKAYNYDITAPAWAQFDMSDYDENPYNKESTATWWSDFNAYTLIIWGDASDTSVDAPAVGDQIKLARYGRQLVFNVVEVEEKPQGINNVIRTVNDNKLYNVLGIEVDKDYKGVVIRNGQKFLQR